MLLLDVTTCKDVVKFSQDFVCNQYYDYYYYYFYWVKTNMYGLQLLHKLLDLPAAVTQHQMYRTVVCCHTSRDM